MKKGTIFAMLSAIALCVSNLSFTVSADSEPTSTYSVQGNAVIRHRHPAPSSAGLTDFTFWYYGETINDLCRWEEKQTDLVAVVLENGTENFDPSAAIPGATLATNYENTSGLGYGDDVLLGMFHKPSADDVHFKDVFLSDFDENSYAIVSGASEQAEKLYELEGVTDVYRMTALFILDSGYISTTDGTTLGDGLTNEQYLDKMQQVKEKIMANDMEGINDLLPMCIANEIAIITPNNYALTRVYEPEPTETTLGDVNFDGTVNLSDVILLRQAVSGSVTLFRTRAAGAAPDFSDIDRDGVTDSNDAIALLRFLLRIDESIG